MQFTVHQEKVFALLDVLVARWIARQYPYNRPDAVIPQTIIPPDLRQNAHTLACWYFYVCIYMRGGIESLQAFNALIKMWRALPHFFDPAHVALMQPSDVQVVLRKYIGWDSKAASINWVYNSRSLMQNWLGDPLNLVKGLKDYDEALRRLRNKRTKRDLYRAGVDGAGFRGYQPKMVSMLIYFYDWERWLKPRFLYPSPADFHNFRLGLATNSITVQRDSLEDLLEQGGDLPTVRVNEKLSAPWRAAVMEYLKKRRADPLEVADALWLFSLLMCGNSPATVTKEPKSHGGLLAHVEVSSVWDHGKWVAAKKSRGMQQTCYVCPFAKECRYAIPAKSYYRQGQLILRPHPLLVMDVPLGSFPDPIPTQVEVDPEIQHILDLIHPAEVSA